MLFTICICHYQSESIFEGSRWNGKDEWFRSLFAQFYAGSAVQAYGSGGSALEYDFWRLVWICGDCCFAAKFLLVVSGLRREVFPLNLMPASMISVVSLPLV